MGTSRLFMALLTELGGLGDRFCYKYVAPNGAPALKRRLFNKATASLCGKRASRSAALRFQPECFRAGHTGRRPMFRLSVLRSITNWWRKFPTGER